MHSFALRAAQRRVVMGRPKTSWRSPRSSAKPSPAAARTRSRLPTLCTMRTLNRGVGSVRRTVGQSLVSCRPVRRRRKRRWNGRRSGRGNCRTQLACPPTWCRGPTGSSSARLTGRLSARTACRSPRPVCRCCWLRTGCRTASRTVTRSCCRPVSGHRCWAVTVSGWVPACRHRKSPVRTWAVTRQLPPWRVLLRHAGCRLTAKATWSQTSTGSRCLDLTQWCRAPIRHTPLRTPPARAAAPLRRLACCRQSWLGPDT